MVQATTRMPCIDVAAGVDIEHGILRTHVPDLDLPPADSIPTEAMRRHLSGQAPRWHGLHHIIISTRKAQKALASQ